jgi:hypothetical protein
MRPLSVPIVLRLSKKVHLGQALVNQPRKLKTRGNLVYARTFGGLAGVRNQIRTGDPHVGNVMRSLNSLMFTTFTVRRGA